MKIFNIRQMVDLIVVIVVAVLCVFLIQSAYSKEDVFSFALTWIFVGSAAFLMLHIVKFIRLYFLLNESHINTGTLLTLYLQCTIVNLLIPFKLGEVYRWYRIGTYIKDYKTALLSLITERFFDISVVLSIMTAGMLFFEIQINNTIIIFALITLFALLCYNGFSPTYRYLNSYFVTKRTSSKDIIALHLLEIGADWNSHQKKITQNKSVMILALSIIIWALEFVTLLCVARSCYFKFSISEFLAYISINVGIELASTSLFFYYVLFSLVLTSILLTISLAVGLIGKKRSCVYSGEIEDGDRCSNE